MAKKPKTKNGFDFVEPHIEDSLAYQLMCTDDFSCCDCEEEPTIDDVEESICLISDLIADATDRNDKEEVASLRRHLNAMKSLKRELKTA